MPTECSGNALSKVIKNMKIRTSNYKLYRAVWMEDLRADAFFFFPQACEILLNYILPDQATS